MIWTHIIVFSQPAIDWYDWLNAFHLQIIVLLLRFFIKFSHEFAKDMKHKWKWKFSAQNKMSCDWINSLRQSNVCQWKMFWKLMRFFIQHSLSRFSSPVKSHIKINKIVIYFLSRALAPSILLLFYRHEKIIMMWKVYLLGLWWSQWAVYD